MLKPSENSDIFRAANIKFRV